MGREGWINYAHLVEYLVRTHGPDIVLRYAEHLAAERNRGAMRQLRMALERLVARHAPSVSEPPLAPPDA